MGQCTIPARDRVSPVTGDGKPNVNFLAMLREEGAPIIGWFNLRYSPDYQFKSQIQNNGDMTVSWTPRQVADGAA